MNIHDPRFKYTPAHASDIRQTIARVREEQRIAAERKRAVAHVESLQTRRVLNVFDARRK